MRLALKLVLAFLLANSLLAALYGYLTVRQEVHSFEQTASEETESLGSAMQGLLADAWHNTGSVGVEEYVHKAASPDVQFQIRWVWFDAESDRTHAPVMPLARLTTVTLQRHEALEEVELDRRRLACSSTGPWRWTSTAAAAWNLHIPWRS